MHTAYNKAGVVKRAKDWLASPEGKKSIRDANDRSLKAMDRLKKARRVDSRSLNRPFNL